MTTRKISGDEFTKAFMTEWEVFVSDHAVTGETPFVERAKWTALMTDPGGFFNRIMDRLNTAPRGLKYQKEWYYIDSLYVGGKDLYRDGLQYPSELHALIEHEFNENLEAEMWKLSHWRCPLKVIISYDWAESEKTTDSRRAYVPQKLKTLWEISKEIDEYHPEARDTEYLVIFATREKEDSDIRWVAHKRGELPSI